MAEEEVAALVVDYGGGMCKAGFACKRRSLRDFPFDYDGYRDRVMWPCVAHCPIFEGYVTQHDMPSTCWVRRRA